MFQKLSLFLKFFLNEFFKLKSKIFFLKNFFKEISLFKLLSFYISKNEFPFRNIDLNKYLEKNTKIWKNTESYSQNKLLVDLTLSSHPLYAIRNCLISKEISKHKKYEIVVLLNRYDFYSYFIAYSFGIRNFIFFDFGNFLIRMYNYLRILKFIDYENLQKNLVKLKYKKFDLGMAAYEHTLRNFLKTIPTDKHNYLFCIALSQALYSAEKSNKIFKKFKIASFVLSELQYIPNRLFFTQALRKKIPVYAGVGGNDAEDLTVRIYNNIKDINSIKSKFSKNLVNFLKKNKSLKKKLRTIF